MGALQLTLGGIAVAVSLVAWAMFVRTVARMVATIRIGQPDATRNGPFVPRMKTLTTEFVAHTRMAKVRSVAPWHWLVMWGFLIGSLALFEAYGEVFVPTWGWPWLSDLAVWSLLMELLGVGTVVGGVALVIIRQLNHPRRADRLSRFAGSNFRQAYFVEAVVIIEGLGILGVRAGKVAMGVHETPVWAAFVTEPVGDLLPASAAFVTAMAFVKLMSAMVWLIRGRQEHDDGRRLAPVPRLLQHLLQARARRRRPAWARCEPMMSDGKPLDFEEADPEKDQFGVAQVEQFTWKGWLDFSTCTECGRCQSQCPAWNTGKPLSPKLLILQLRDHAYAKAPYLLAGGGKDLTGEEKATGDNPHAGIDVLALAEADRPLIGSVDEQGVIDPDVLWSCTTCGACVEQCPVDIEHVDHIVDMRRYQVLIESNFPPEAGVMLRNLENKGNPWGRRRTPARTGPRASTSRCRSSSGELGDFEYLFWVGCAGAFEDRAKKTTRAVAKLLHEAGVKYAILGEGETCTGDPARRMGNEFLFQMLAQQNVEVLDSVFEGREAGKRKIVATCPHCFNTLANEYEQLGGKLEVVHHTQLLAHLVASGSSPRSSRSTGTSPTTTRATWAGTTGSSTRRASCSARPAANLREMPRTANAPSAAAPAARGCGWRRRSASGSTSSASRRRWPPRRRRSRRAARSARCSATASPARPSQAGEHVEVVDVAQLLLASVKRPPATPADPVDAADATESADTPTDDEPTGTPLPDQDTTAKQG